MISDAADPRSNRARGTASPVSRYRGTGQAQDDGPHPVLPGRDMPEGVVRADEDIAEQDGVTAAAAFGVGTRIGAV